MIRRLQAALRSPHLVTLALLLAGMASAAGVLAANVRGLETGLALGLALAAVLTGWLLAAASISAWAGLGGLLLAGLVVLLLRVGQLARPLLYLLWALGRLGAGAARTPLSPSADVALLQAAWDGFAAGLTAVIGRTAGWVAALPGGRAGDDPLAIALAWGLLLWLACGWAGWALGRHLPALAALAPTLALVSGTLSYVRAEPAGLLPLLSALLLLAPWTSHVLRERRWERSGVDFSPETRMDLAFATLVLALFIFQAALLASTVSFPRMIESLRRAFEDTSGRSQTVARSLGLEPKPVSGPPDAFGAFRAPGLPREHLLGSGPELSHRVVMTVSTGEVPPGASLEGLAGLHRYYWRALSYDVYTGRGWFTSNFATTQYPAGGQAADPDRADYRRLDLEIRLSEDQGSLLFAAGPVVTADQPFTIAWRGGEDVFAGNIPGDAYHVTTLAPAFSADQLRQAGRDYPEEIARNALRLPEGLPERVRALARDLTATAANPYDQALAIQTYLRTYVYTLDLDAPPSNRDVVDYFLFDLKRGYCDYYASAMVVLARSVGIPARLASGYASGRYDPAAGRFVVTEADAHSWAEIYFPGYGWAPFEATAARGAIDYTAGASVPPSAAENEPDLTGAIPPPAGPLSRVGARVWPVALAAPALAALVLAAAAAIERRRLNALPPAQAVSACYRGLWRAGPRFQVTPIRGDTPDEYAARLAQRVAELNRSARWGIAWLPQPAAVEEVAAIYGRALYSPRPPTPSEARRTLATWLRLRGGFIWLWIWSKVAGLAYNRPERKQPWPKN